jgi:hypothetical protein
MPVPTRVRSRVVNTRFRRDPRKEHFVVVCMSSP